ncbi:MAG: hypothetical protein J1G02_06340 [Clostridiales bacterium]|nr:hypothetical protein [Clostridiales bacterium]
MGFFSKKATVEKPTVDELIKSIAQLSDEEKEKLYAQAFGEVDEPNESTDDSEKMETETEVPVEEPVKHKPANGEANEDTEEAEQNVEERHEEVVAALTARVEAVEQQLAEFKEIVGDFVALSNNDSPLGVAATPTVGNAEDDLTEDDRIMTSYNPNYRRG